MEAAARSARGEAARIFKSVRRDRRMHRNSPLRIVSLRRRVFPTPMRFFCKPLGRFRFRHGVGLSVPTAIWPRPTRANTYPCRCFPAPPPTTSALPTVKDRYHVRQWSISPHGRRQRRPCRRGTGNSGARHEPSLQECLGESLSQGVIDHTVAEERPRGANWLSSIPGLHRQTGDDAIPIWCCRLHRMRRR